MASEKKPFAHLFRARENDPERCSPGIDDGVPSLLALSQIQKDDRGGIADGRILAGKG